MKKTTLIIIQIMLTTLAFSQWASPGTMSTSHANGDQPNILGFGGALLELEESNLSPIGSPNGLFFTRQNNNGLSSIAEAYLHYHTNANQLLFSETGNLNDAVFSIDVDNGNMEITGDFEMADGRDIQFDSGLGSEIVWTSDTGIEQGHLRSTGTDAAQNFDLESQFGTVTIDGQTVELRVADARRVELDNDELTLDGFLDINTSRFNTAIQVDGNEALWYTDGRFSWGFGGEYNFFADEVRIGGSGVPTPSFQLEVVGDADISGELTAASDRRLKKNISDINGALSLISELAPKTYNFRVDEYPDMDLADGDKMGFIAQEIEMVLPELVRTGRNVESIDGESFNSKSVNYVELIPLLTKAIQEQQDIIDSQNDQLTAMQSKIDDVLSIVASLSADTDDSLKTTSED